MTELDRDKKNWLDPWQEGWAGPTPAQRAAWGERPVSIFYHRDFQDNDLIVDCDLGAVVSRSDANKLDSVLHAMHIQAIGLFDMFMRVADLETERVLEQKKLLQTGGSLPGRVTGPSPIVASVFQAYSVSICAYVRGVAHIIEEANAWPGGKPSDWSRREYVKSVVGPILKYRNKIGAHPSCYDQDGRDSVFDRHASALAGWLSFDRGYYWAPAFASVPEDEPFGGSIQTGLTPWSLTRGHMQFNKRYWIGPAGDINKVYYPPFSSASAYVEFPFAGSGKSPAELGVNLGRFV